MPSRLFAMILRNLFRSRTRLVVTVLGCMIAAVVICFFMSAEQSLQSALGTAQEDANLIVRQKDRF